MAVINEADGSQLMSLEEFVPVMCRGFISAVDAMVDAECELEKLRGQFSGRPPHVQHMAAIEKLTLSRMELMRVRNGAAEVTGVEQVELGVKSGNLILLGGGVQ